MIVCFLTGILIALSIPTYKGPNLQGVASIDLVVSQLLTDVTYFKEGHNAYRFLIEQSGRLICSTALLTCCT